MPPYPTEAARIAAQARDRKFLSDWSTAEIQDRQIQDATMSQRAHPTPFGFTPPLDMKAYGDELNRRTRLTDFRSQGAGKGPAKGVYMQHAPGLRSSRPGLGSLSMDDDYDDPDFRTSMKSLALQEGHTRQALMDEGLKGARMQNEHGFFMQGQDELDRMFPEGRDDAELFSGRTQARARTAGDIQRGEGLETARSGARAFMDPTVRQARGLQVDEQERLLNARYGREADAMAKIEAARIAAGAKTESAKTAAGGALTREAIRGLLKSRELSGLLGGKQPTPQQAQQLEGLLNHYAGAEEEQPQWDDVSLNALISGAQTNQAGADQLAGVWEQLTPQQQARVRAAMGRGRR